MSGRLYRRGRTALIAAVLLFVSAGAHREPAPARPFSPSKPTAPIDVSLTCDPASGGCCRITLKATSRVDLPDATLLIQGESLWRGPMARGETITVSTICAMPAFAHCCFTGGVLADLPGGVRVAAPCQVELNAGLRPPSDGAENVNRLGQRLLEFPGVTTP